MPEVSADIQERHRGLLSLMNEFGAIGLNEQGGISRLAGSTEDGQARDALCAWFAKHEFDVCIDEIGNIFGVFELNGASSNDAFYCGSHLDTQPNAGAFDGALGVVAACHAALELKRAVEQGELKSAYRYFVVVNWTGEEGARYQPSLIGSSVFTKQLSIDKALSLSDSDGIQLGDALDAIGYRGTAELPLPKHYLELHVEQDTQLEREQLPIGVVTHAWGARKYLVEIKGESNHTGPTPMAARVDALLAASQLVVAVNEISRNAEAELYSSVGKILVQPNSPNTVAGNAQLWVEFRSADQRALDAAHEEFISTLSSASSATGCLTEVLIHTTRPVAAFDKTSIDVVANSFATEHTGFKTMSTVAGHDALALQHYCPSTLLFVPSKDGITHSPDEFTSERDIALGFDAMMVALKGLVSTERCEPTLAEEASCNQ